MSKRHIALLFLLVLLGHIGLIWLFGQPSPGEQAVLEELLQLELDLPQPPAAEPLPVEPQAAYPAAPQLVSAPLNWQHQAGSPSMAMQPVSVAAPTAISFAVPVAKAQPRYPLAARQQRQQGTVLVAFQVDSQGMVSQMRVQESSGYPLLDDSVLEAVKHWRFKPTLIDDKRVDYWYKQRIRFAIKQRQHQQESL